VKPSANLGGGLLTFLTPLDKTIKTVPESH